MKITEKQKTIIIVLISIFIFVIITLLLVNQTKPKQIVTPTPAQSINMPTRSQLSPTLVPPAFTGGNLDLPKELMDLAGQKTDLRLKTPLQETSFSIDFDYDNDKFIVTIKEPKATNRVNFDEWLKKNYPAIPIDRFNFL